MSVNVKTNVGLSKIAGLYPQQQVRLDNLGQTQISNPVSGQELIYDGTKWINNFVTVVFNYDYSVVTSVSAYDVDTGDVWFIPLSSTNTQEFLYYGQPIHYIYSWSIDGTTYSSEVDANVPGKIYTITLSAEE